MSNQLFTILFSVLATLSINAQKSSLADPIGTPECKAWVDSVYSTMTLDEKIGQLMLGNVSPKQGEKSMDDVRAFVKDGHVGGLFFSAGDSKQFAELANYAQSLSRVPLLMCIDGEWGPAMRVTDAPKFPHNMTLGAIQDPVLIYRTGYEVGRQCQALGIRMDFAPVLDVNSNPNNPVIGMRSFGEDPARVALDGVQWSLGLQDAGVIAVGKHFPGHGDTDSDSHKTLPTVHHSEQTFDAVDLLPFKRFIDADCSGIMVGHLSVPAFDKSGRPASMSRLIDTDLLQDRLGFKGLVITDGLGMKGAQVDGNICVAALKAGNDLLCGPKAFKTDMAAIRKALDSGELPMVQFENSVKKMLSYKYAVGLTSAPVVNVSTIHEDLNTPQALALIQDLANNSITLVRDQAHAVPVGNLDKAKIAVVNIGDGANDFSSLCTKYAEVEVIAAKGHTLTAEQIQHIKKCDVVIVGVYSDDKTAQNAFSQLRGVKGLIPVFFINPYKVSLFKSTLASCGTLVMAYEDNVYQQRAAAMAVFGGIDVNGIMPVNVEGVAKVGDGVSVKKSRLGYSSPAAEGLDPHLAARMDSVVNVAMAAGAFPGAQLLVVKNGDVVIDQCYGLTTKGGEKVTDQTLYDLASVSKAVGTLPGVMKAYDLGLFDLDAPAHNYIPGLNVAGKDDITPRMLLHHETGMPAGMNMYYVMMDPDSYSGSLVSGKRDKDHTIAINGGGYGHRTAKMRTDIVSDAYSDKYDVELAKGIFTGKIGYDTVMSRIYNIDVKPTKKFLYSCLNFCLLMDLEQRVTHQSHDQWVTDSVWAPIGAYNMCYRPTGHAPLSRIAATEDDTFLRRQHVHGYVHDELAAFSGGLQGNAGVFGTANDIAKLCYTWQNGGVYGDKRIFSEATNHLFTTDKSPTCRRGLGFDKPDMANKDDSPTCDEASAATYGHTGFTGTCFWVDPEHDLIFVFLCNRVDPSRANKAFSDSLIRPTLMSMVYEAM